jgi:hypothetical protein
VEKATGDVRGNMSGAKHKIFSCNCKRGHGLGQYVPHADGKARAANQLFLLNDAGTAWSAAAPGAGVMLSNSACSVNAAAASVTPPGDGPDLDPAGGVHGGV